MPILEVLQPITTSSLVLLVILYGAQLFVPQLFRRAVRPLFFVAAVGVGIFLLHLASERFVAWQSNPLTKHFVPPSGDMAYFIGYVGFRLFGFFAASFLAAILFSFAARWMNRRYGERFFEHEEIWLGMLVIFLVGWPGALLYVFSMLLFTFFGSLFLQVRAWYLKRVRNEHLCRRLMRKLHWGTPGEEETRFPLYYAWIPAGILVILIRGWVLAQTGLWILGFSQTF